MNRIYIAIGSNLNTPLQQVMHAIKELHQLPNTKRIAVSSLYNSKPMGPQNQPDYLNAVIALDTDLLPEILLKHTQYIELKHNRMRKSDRWGPRTLDLDIMLYGKQVIQTSNLTIPHYGIKEREFMLYPLSEITPELRFPDDELLCDRLKLINNSGISLYNNISDNLFRGGLSKTPLFMNNIQ